MRLIPFLFYFLFSVPFFAQTTKIIVPEQFDFLKEKDAYQMNSITVFLLQKKGVNASFANDAGTYANCEVAFADVIKLKSFLATKLQLIIKDCEGTILYESPEGSSKFKDFRKAFQDALRDIFKQIEADTIIVTLPALVANKETLTTTNSVKENNASQTEVNTPPAQGLVPKSTFTSFTRQKINYVLKKTLNGFLWYKEDSKTGDLQSIGVIEMNTKDTFYLSTKGDHLVKGYFDASGNLYLIEKGLEIQYQRVN